MARATTMKFEELTLEVETTTPGTYAKVCGLIDVTVTFTVATAEAMVPDCDDESLPLAMEREVVSTDWSVSATGVWAQESHEQMIQWSQGAVENIRIGFTGADTGDVEFIAGPAIMTTLTVARTKGQKVSQEIELVGAGARTLTDQT
jgi:hypothetical protein